MESLIEHLVRTGVLRTPRIIDAFKAIDRKDFVPEEETAYAYEDHALSIGFGQTISQPTTVAIMLELLDPQPGETVLDLGSGSGWTTTLLAHIVGNEGSVIGLERIPELAVFGAENLQKYELPGATIREADETPGAPDEAPFDRILVSATSEHVPEELIEQLSVGGTMVIPIGDGLEVVRRTGEKTTDRERIEGFVFVPLITSTRKR